MKCKLVYCTDLAFRNIIYHTDKTLKFIDFGFVCRMEDADPQWPVRVRKWYNRIQNVDNCIVRSGDATLWRMFLSCAVYQSLCLCAAPELTTQGEKLFDWPQDCLSISSHLIGSLLFSELLYHKKIFQAQKPVHPDIKVLSEVSIFAQTLQYLSGLSLDTATPWVQYQVRLLLRVWLSS